MLARLNVNKLLGRHEQAAGDAAEKSFGNLTAALQALDAATKGADYRKNFDDLQAGVTNYRDSYRKAADLERGIDTMANGTMRDIGQQVQTDAELIKASGIAEEKQEEHDTLSTMASTSSLILYLSVGGLLAGAVLAWPTSSASFMLPALGRHNLTDRIAYSRNSGITHSGFSPRATRSTLSNPLRKRAD